MQRKADDGRKLKWHFALGHKTPRDAGDEIIALAEQIKTERKLAGMCPVHGDKKG